MSKPILLDLFCGQGGAAAGYTRTGFEVFGVDHKPQPLYPFWFHHGDALAVADRLRAGLGVEFTAKDGRRRMLFQEQIRMRHASPPCQALSTITPDKSKHVNLIPDVRERFEPTVGPWVIENVEGAKRHLREPVRLCGSSFNLKVRRHRLFETSVPLMALPCQHARQGQPLGVYGSHGDARGAVLRPDGSRRGLKARDVHEAREVMQMPWADWYGCAQAIPPAYTAFIGGQIIERMDRESVPA